jgi:hypothetical protein
MIEKGALFMRHRIKFNTVSDANAFMAAIYSAKEKVTLEDDDGHCVSALSLLGVLYSFEWKTIYCTCEKDISELIIPWQYK